ncbi:MAG: glycosyl transferase, family 39, partial [Nocardioidaceae bacterium]|nr:glycosyl transferase, family 39 [Nocardioidaceae bacterium]
MTTLTTRAPATQAAAPKTAKRTRVWAWGRTERLAFAGLLAVTAIAYLWNLSINGYSNEYYSMAIQAGSQSWSSWFFGSLDTSNFITVDKTPASLWVMGLSARVFGFSSFAMLLPQALMMVGSVALLYAAVRRWFTAPAAWIAGAVLATTPVAALMFRFNNPDALLVLLMIGAAYAVTRAIDAEKAMRWLVLAGVLIGFAFLTKMMQAFLVLPAFVAAYGLAGKGTIGIRLRGLLAAFGAMIVAAGWWVAIVELIPASSRPIIGGSTNDSILELTLGYNGIGRLNGNEAGSVGGGGGNGGSQWGTTGFGRLFGSEMGTQISWLLPAALLSIGVLVALAARSPRDDKRRTFALLWGGWLLVTGLTFSFMQGIVHSYYTVALAPAIGALVGVGAVELWKIRGDLLARAVLAGGTLLTASWIFHLLSTTWNPWLRPVTLAAGVLGAVLVLVGPELAHQWGRRVALATVALIATAAFLGPVAYSATTISAAHTGAIPSA